MQIFSTWGTRTWSRRMMVWSGSLDFHPVTCTEASPFRGQGEAPQMAHPVCAGDPGVLTGQRRRRRLTPALAYHMRPMEPWQTQSRRFTLAVHVLCADLLKVGLAPLRHLAHLWKGPSFHEAIIMNEIGANGAWRRAWS